LQQDLQATGFNLFNKYASSDHRALFVDFNLSHTLGKPNPAIVPPGKRFVSSRSADVSKFVPKMASHLHKNKVFHKFHEFLVDCNTHAKPWEGDNAIDSLLGQAFKTAKRHCATPERPPWSEKLHIASMKVRYWQVALTVFLLVSHKTKSSLNSVQTIVEKYSHDAPSSTNSTFRWESCPPCSSPNLS
jgi:hypothetical protein